VYFLGEDMTIEYKTGVVSAEVSINFSRVTSAYNWVCFSKGVFDEVMAEITAEEHRMNVRLSVSKWTK
jgi:hypothetical protein